MGRGGRGCAAQEIREPGRAGIAAGVTSGAPGGLAVLANRPNSGLAQALDGAVLPAFDFRQVAETRGWVAAHDLSMAEPTAEGLRLQIDGVDPYLPGSLCLGGPGSRRRWHSRLWVPGIG